MVSVKLGEEAPYSSHYNPALLEAIPRQLSRSALLLEETLPFVGVDIWTAYELSWLTSKGKPCVAIGEFRFPCDSAAIIESKSFKYYLNSFNQTAFDNKGAVVEALIKELSAACGGAVEVTLFAIDEYRKEGTVSQGLCVDDLDVDIDVYQPNRQLIECEPVRVLEQALYSHLLKSNCPVTGQPDWATISIRYSGYKISPESFLRYVVSFRQHQDFHENCVEKIYCDLMAVGCFDELMVYARYTRRGGLDINPARASANVDAAQLERWLDIRIARQ
ncbi:NADPH-dependent 7-cyano-7-deazaguanine reductase QueF [Teredinibacter purpureus]|uniref:NADPH-dependent 7-cyano-7-deazaguanine reductase QueF n=1 Tax=Teredinibacter purpureus TaxID=2731756 RepID=UPI0005F836F7|nr:NADPH-dependent 7-cyano-7-deazaguanine reductase QueF [Teredinibacter purpureus]